MVSQASFEDRARAIEWLNELARLIPKAMEMADLLGKIDNYAGLLAMKVPPSLLTPDSMEFCARRFKFWPSYAELWGRLQQWQRENPPPRPALPAPPPIDDPELSEHERMLVAQWYRLRPDRVRSGHLVVALDRLRREERAFRYVCLRDVEAEAIALQRGWIVDRHEPAIGTDPAGIVASVRAVYEPLPNGQPNASAATLIAYLRAGTERNAPENLSVLEDAVERYRPAALHPGETEPIPGDALTQEVAKAHAAFEAKHGRKPGQMTPEQIAAMRAKAGITGLPDPQPQPPPPKPDPLFPWEQQC